MSLPDARISMSWFRSKLSKHTLRPLVVRGDIEPELWNMLEYYSEIEEVGIEFIRQHGVQGNNLQRVTFKAFQAYIRQAKSYYTSAKSLHYRSSSLLYYYSFLNLVKAYLLLTAPRRVMNQRIGHGLSYNPNSRSRDFRQEKIKIVDGVFRLLYEQETGKSVRLNSSLNIVKLLSYCTDISYQYESAGFGQHSMLYSIACMQTHTQNQEAWMLIGIPKFNSLDNFPGFRNRFLRLYEEVSVHEFRTREYFQISALQKTAYRFFQDRTIVHWPSPDIPPTLELRDKLIDTLNPFFNVHYFEDGFDLELALPYLPNRQIPFNEILSIYCVMFYLSSLVRYKPNYLEELLNHKPAWLVEGFVNSTPETFLRIFVNHIIGIDYIFLKR